MAELKHESCEKKVHTSFGFMAWDQFSSRNVHFLLVFLFDLFSKVEAHLF